MIHSAVGRRMAARNRAGPDNEVSTPDGCHKSLFPGSGKRLFRSEQDLHRKLNLASRYTNGAYNSELRGVHRKPRISEIRVIECVEQFGSKLESSEFVRSQRHARVLHRGEIHRVHPGSNEYVVSRIPEHSERMIDEAAGIEPSGNGSLSSREVAIANAIRTVSVGAPDVDGGS